MMEQLTDEERYLLLGKLTGTLTQGEEALVERLLRENPHAQAAYAEAEAAYAGHGTDPQWADITGRVRVPERVPTYAAGLRRMTWRRWVAAAAIVILLAVSYLLWKQSPDNPSSTPRLASKTGIELRLSTGERIDLSAQRGDISVGNLQLSNTGEALLYTDGENSDAEAHHTLVVPVGLDYQITLADGTTVWLNSATELEFPEAFGDDTREIRIEGEAYLAVVKDPERPFIVNLPGSRVEVLGTEFNVNTYDGGIEKVALVSGAVRMATAEAAGQATGASVSLAPGQLGTHTQGQPIAVDTFDTRDVLSWREGRYYFREATLHEISRVLPRWYGIAVSIDDADDRSRRFTGMIDRDQPLSVFQDDLKAISGIDSHVDDQGVLHIGR